MIKKLLRNIAFYAISLYALPHIVGGVKIFGGFQTLLIGGFVLALMFTILKPIFTILTFPFNFMTLGLFSLITNAVILYLLTVFVPNITINAYIFPGATVFGFIIPLLHFNTMFAFLTAAFVLSIISGTLRWLIH